MVHEPSGSRYENPGAKQFFGGLRQGLDLRVALLPRAGKNLNVPALHDR